MELEIAGSFFTFPNSLKIVFTHSRKGNSRKSCQQRDTTHQNNTQSRKLKNCCSFKNRTTATDATKE